MNTKKGTYGYLSRERKKYLGITVLLFAAVFVIFFAARILLGTNQNIFSIIAALLCLPAARMAVNLVMLVRAKGCSSAAHERIKAVEDPASCLYDLCLTTYDKTFDLSHLCVYGTSVIALSEREEVPEKDLHAAEDHIRRSMHKSGFHGYGVKVFSRLDPYLQRMQDLYEHGEEERAEKEKESILQLLLQLAL